MKGHLKDETEDQFDDKNIIISAENLHKTYLFGLEGVAALRGVTVNIRQGEFVIILGNSGGGKTSLLNILGTIDKLTKVRYCRFRDISTSTTRRSRKAPLMRFYPDSDSTTSASSSRPSTSSPLSLHCRMSNCL